MQAAFVILLLIGLNGLFVAAEFSAVAARRNRIAGRARQGRGSARILLEIMQNPVRLDRYISTCQLGITTTSLALGAYGEQALAGALSGLLVDLGAMQAVAAHSIAVILVLVLLSVLQLLVAEQVPKSYALARPNTVALTTVRLVLWAQRLLSPFIFVLNGIAQLILRMLRAPSLVYSHVHSRQEIDLLLDESHEGGLLAQERHRQLASALELEELTARQLMVPRPKVSAIDLEADSDEVMRIILDGPHTRLPVYKGSIDKVVGILHTKDLARRAVETGRLGNWRPLLRPVTFVSEGMTADRLIARMREARCQQAIVMDEFGGMEGLVTLEDVLRHVFGAVGDEFSAEPAEVQELAPGRFRVPGEVRLDRVEELLGVELQGTATTLGGLVVEHLGSFPEKGVELQMQGLEVVVDAVDQHRVEHLLVRVAASEEELSS